MDGGVWWAAVHAAALMAETEEELKSLLTKVKVESEKVGLKLNIQKAKIMVILSVVPMASPSTKALPESLHSL